MIEVCFFSCFIFGNVFGLFLNVVFCWIIFVLFFYVFIDFFCKFGEKIVDVVSFVEGFDYWSMEFDVGLKIVWGLGVEILMFEVGGLGKDNVCVVGCFVVEVIDVDMEGN